MAFVTTPGAANANSYASVAEFKTYRDSRLPAVAWAVAATDPEIEVALIMAARLQDALFDWTGTAADEVQALSWPRIGMLNRNGFAIASTVNPQALKDAQCEFALQLGNGDRVSDDDAAKSNLSSVKAGSVAVSFQNVDTSSPEAVDMAIRRMGSEFNYISKTVPDAVRQLLVPSWFNQPSINRPILFGVM